jgi:antitoxin (DNA-binding transcriptional repressor) of toxin-antitoxin stability system
MTIPTSLPETTAQLARMIERVQAGEEILLAQGGVPIARIVPIQAASPARIPGQDRGHVTIAPDFNAPLPEDLLNDFLSAYSSP